MPFATGITAGRHRASYGTGAATPFVPPANVFLGANQTVDMANWFIPSGVTSALNVTDYAGNANGANTLTASAGNSQHDYFSFNLTATGTTTYACAMKAGTVNFGTIWGNADASSYASFDLSGGGSTVAHGSATSFMQPLGGGWFWCSVTVPPSGQLMLVQVADSLAHAQPASWSAAGTETILVGPFAVT